MAFRARALTGLILTAFAAFAASTAAQQRFITVASTTSTEQSGLFGDILPAFKARTGIEVRVVALGTGQARRLADEVLFMSAGRVADHAPVERFFAQPSTGEAAAFIKGELPWS